MDFLQKT